MTDCPSQPPDAGEPPPPAEEPTFEQAVERVEQIVRELEEGRLELHVALARYEEAVRFVQCCYRLLEGAERKVELLLQIDERGEARTEAFETPAESLPEKARQRDRRRSRPSDPDRPLLDDRRKPGTDVDL